jgi:thiamine biosynthesis lipoprotein
MKKTVSTILIMIIIFSLFFSGCKHERYEKFSAGFFDAFDTYITVIGYTETEEEFEKYFQQIKSRFIELHKLYDKFNLYEGINNIKTINDNAGIQPVYVDKEIIDLILFSKKWFDITGEKTNIAFGPVLEIWHEYFIDASFDADKTRIPPMEELQAANQLTDLSKVLVDEQNSTIFLLEKGMSLDVGAVAKGFATEIVAREIMEEGFESGIISSGGNIRIIGQPLDGIRQYWGIGIQHPDKPVINDIENTLDVLYINDASVVSSGDYQRYYFYNGDRIHHIIDPDTLMPGKSFRAVTVVAKDAGVGDFLSTSLFLLSYEDGLALVESLDGVDAYWVMPDLTTQYSSGMKKLLRSQGASGSVK